MAKKDVNVQDRLRLYLQGRLTPEEVTEFEIYFIDKPELLEQLELETLLQKHLPLVKKENKTISSKWLSWLAQPLLASFATLVICVFSFSLYLQMEKSEYGGSSKVDLIYISPMRSSSQEPQASFSIARGVEQITVVLQPGEISATSFNIKMFNSQKEQVIGFEQVRMQGMGDLVISVPSKLLKPGLWTFELSSSSQSDAQEVLVLNITN